MKHIHNKNITGQLNTQSRIEWRANGNSEEDQKYTYRKEKMLQGTKKHFNVIELRTYIGAPIL